MRKMVNCSEAMKELKPVAAMVLSQATLAGANVFYKLAAFDGMSLRVLIAYRFLFAAIFIDVSTLIMERNKRPKLTWVVVGQAFLCGFLACGMAQNLYAQALILTSVTFASAMFNLVPAFTFILAVCFGLEKLGLKTPAGKAKLLGTIACISGAMVLTFYKGPELNIWHKTFNLMKPHKGHVATTQHENIGLGAVLLFLCCFSAAIGLIVQAKMLRNYPCTYSSTALMITMGALQTVIFALYMERSDWSQWKLGWNVRLFAATFTGMVSSGAAFIVAAWCIKMKGPLYVSVFNPLMLVLVAIAGSLVLNEMLHVGSVIGAVVIVCGLYLVLWGKGKELQRMAQLVVPSEPSVRSDASKSIKDILEELDNEIANANSMVGVYSNDIAFVYQDSIEGDRKSFSERDEIVEEVKGGRLNNAEKV